MKKFECLNEVKNLEPGSDEEKEYLDQRGSYGWKLAGIRSGGYRASSGGYETVYYWRREIIENETTSR